MRVRRLEDWPAGLHGPGPRHQSGHQARRGLPFVLQQALERDAVHAWQFRRRLQAHRFSSLDAASVWVVGVAAARQVHALQNRLLGGDDERSVRSLHLRRSSGHHLSILPRRPLRRLRRSRQASLPVDGPEGRREKEGDVVRPLGRFRLRPALPAPLLPFCHRGVVATAASTSAAVEVDYGVPVPGDFERDYPRVLPQRFRRGSDKGHARLRLRRARAQGAVQSEQACRLFAPLQGRRRGRRGAGPPRRFCRAHKGKVL
mmetsp:Transcript_17201/g.58144  ORF Transcript_17201/g.58144 Transcript_17201/m.58144 type:complete len:259 (-) Transcript_17201:402-1178(-)